MALALIDGIETYYEVAGSGPPVLMCAPGGFDADVRKWSTQGIYAKLRFLDHLAQHFTCIIYDRRDTGRSGGRVEPVDWPHYARHGKMLLDHLGFAKAFVMGGCMGCSVAMAIAVAYPEATERLVLFWPVGGARYRINGHLRFAEHMGFVNRDGLKAVVDLARSTDADFGRNPRVGPWVATLRNDDGFAARYASLDVQHYKLVLSVMARKLMDRDTSPGADAEDLMRLSVPTLIIPGSDAAHATSAARYLEECIPGASYWDVPVKQQVETNTNAEVLRFLQPST